MVNRLFNLLSYLCWTLMQSTKHIFYVLLLSGVCIFVPNSAYAETLEGALTKAYSQNPTLNAQRAATRATDENVPQAKAQGRPTISLSGDAGLTQSDGKAVSFGGKARYSELYQPRGAGVTVNQTLWNGNRTENSTRAAESQIMGARQTLRNTEQTVLLNGATAYMNVLRDTAVVNLKRNNVDVLEEQLRQTNDRFKVGEVTRTDVAQAQSRVAASKSDAILAQANLKASLANYRQQVGDEPKLLLPGKSVEKILPLKVEKALQIALSEHPAIIGAQHGVDAQLLQVKVAESDLYPNLSVQGNIQNRWAAASDGTIGYAASVVARLSVPIYEGGAVYSKVRQAKETLGQTQINVDIQRDVVRAAVVQSLGQLEASKAQIISTQAQVKAAEIALNGVREEAKVGQRTTLDVLNAQQELINARVSFIVAQRDRVVNSYNVLASIGRLDAQSLQLKVGLYNPKVHYEQVKDKWIGLRTPDGK
jgi:outer membrane protein